MAQAQLHGAGFIFDSAKVSGRSSLVPASSLDVARNPGCLRKTYIGIHCNAIGGSEIGQRWWKKQAGTLVWSPFSNLWLYGSTANIPGSTTTGDQCEYGIGLGAVWRQSTYSGN